MDSNPVTGPAFLQLLRDARPGGGAISRSEILTFLEGLDENQWVEFLLYCAEGGEWFRELLAPGPGETFVALFAFVARRLSSSTRALAGQAIDRLTAAPTTLDEQHLDFLLVLAGAADLPVSQLERLMLDDSAAERLAWRAASVLASQRPVDALEFVRLHGGALSLELRQALVDAASALLDEETVPTHANERVNVLGHAIQTSRERQFNAKGGGRGSGMRTSAAGVATPPDPRLLIRRR